MNKKFTKLIAALALLVFMMPSLVGWGQNPLSTSDLNFGTPYISEDFNSTSTCDLTSTVNPYSESITTLGQFNYVYNNNTANHYGVYANTTFSTNALKVTAGSGSQVIVGITKKGSSAVQFENTGAFSVKILKTDKCYFGLYSTLSSSNAMSKNDVSVFITNTNGTLTIHNGASSNNNQTIGTYTTDDIIEICVVYNNSSEATTYGNNIALDSKKAHIYVNGNCVMDGENPKAFTIPGRDLKMFRAVPFTSNGNVCTIDDLKIYNELPISSTATSITAANVDLSWNATEGSIGYTINNGVTGGSLSASTEADWITIGTVTESAVPFTCNANPNGTARPATVTLTYKNSNNETLATKNVTVTQAFRPSYTVTYYKNGSSVTGSVPQSASYLHGATVTVSENTGNLALTGYNWNGWNTQANGEGTPYAAGATFNITENVDLYAQWTLGSYGYTITKTGQADHATAQLKIGETVLEANATIPYQNDVTIDVTPETGYTYTVSVKDANNATVTVTNNHFTMPGSAVTVTVNVLKIYQVTIDPAIANGSATANPTSGIAGTSITLTPNPAVGYYLSAWNVYKTGDPETTVSVSNNNKFDMPEYDVTVSAAYAERIATFTDGVYTEGLGSTSSFNNMSIVNVTGTGTWSFSSQYSCALIKFSDAQEDWLITPKMPVENGKLNISFQIWYKNPSNLALKWSNSLSGGWTEISFDKGNASTWNTISKDIETSNPFVYVAFVYTNTNTENAQYEIKNIKARQYYNVEFDANLTSGVTGEMEDLSCAAGVATELPTNVFSATGKVFQGWNTQANGNGTSYDDGGSITLNSNIKLYAQWADTHTVSFITNGVADGSKTVIHGATIGELPEATAAYIPAGYTFMGWLATEYAVSDDAPEAYIASSYPVNSDVVLRAVFALGTTTEQSQNKTMTLNDQLIKSGNGYQDGTATIDNISLSYNKCLKSSGFIQMQATNGEIHNTSAMGTKIDSISVTVNTNTSGMSLDRVVVKEGSGSNNISTNVSGNNGIYTFSGNTQYFMITNNGSYSQVKATVYYAVTTSVTTYSNYRTSLIEYKDLHIDGYNGDGGWYLIASPVFTTPAEVENMLIDEDTPPYSYDLYRFNQSADLEWENYHNHTADFNIIPGQGYLYARSEDVDLTFSGAPYGGDGEINLSYDSEAELPGWNLIGNPFGTAATLDLPYYQMNATHTALGAKVENGEIAVMEGVFVYAYDQTTSQTIATATFTPTGRSANTPQGIVNLNVENKGSVIDNAIVRFDEGRTLPKFYFGNANANLYIPQNDKEYAIATSEAQGEMPLNFRANADGQYTLTVNPEGIEMNYLHLIDNMTGANVDLLSTPSYTFTAKTTDYESRFRLVFASNGTSTSSATEETFAFFSNGNLVVNNEGEATLQVIDVMGRVLSSQTISGTAELSLNQVPGVYVLRLVNGNDVKTQKIVVR